VVIRSFNSLLLENVNWIKSMYYGLKPARRNGFKRCLAFVVMLFATLPLFGYIGKIEANGIVWPYLKSDRWMRLLGINEFVSFEYAQTITSAVVPERISISEYSTYEVSTLDGTFGACYNLTSVTLPNTILKLDGTFASCRSLTSLSIPPSVTTITGCCFSDTGLTRIVIPATVQNISGLTFFLCKKAESIVFENPALLTRICAGSNYGMFQRCFALKTFDIPSHVTKIGGCAFAESGIEEIVIPEGITTIYDATFYSCKQLASVTLPSSLRTIGTHDAEGPSEGEGAFQNCRALTHIEFPECLDWISGCTFCGSGLQSIDIPAKVRYVGRDAFMGSSDLADVVIRGETQIDDGAFTSCGIKRMKLHDAVRRVPVFPRGKLERFEAGTGIDNLVTLSYAPLLTEVVLHGAVTNIGSWAFSNCTSLRGLELPSTVRTIGQRAFEVCRKLESLELPDGLEYLGDGAFAGCVALRSVSIPEKITMLGETTFSGCTNLHTVTLNKGLKTVSPNVFRKLTALEALEFPRTVSMLGANVCQECTALESVSFNGVHEEIPEQACYGCENLTRVMLSGDVRRIGRGAFVCCNRLEEIEFPKSVTNIASSAFYGSGLRHLDLSGMNVNLGSGAFGRCNELTSVILHKGAKCPTGDAFSDCTSISEIEIDDWALLKMFDPATVKTVRYCGDVGVFDGSEVAAFTNLEEIVFVGTLEAVADGAFCPLKELRRVQFGSGLDSIGESAFEGCASLSEINLPGSLSFVGQRAFRDCTSLSDLTLGEGLTEIPAYAFEGCTALRMLTVPASIELVRQYAFHSCSNLQSITWMGTDGRVALFDSAFDSCTSLLGIDLRPVLAVGSETFQNCTAITVLSIPANVMFVDDFSFAGCTNIVDLTIDYREVYESGVTNLFDIIAHPGLGTNIRPRKFTTGIFPNGIEVSAIRELNVADGVVRGGDRLYTPPKCQRVSFPASLLEAKGLAIGGPKYRVAEDNPNYAHDGNGSLRSKDGSAMLGWANLGRRWYGGMPGETSLFLREVSKIGDCAFQNCDKLELVCFSSCVTQIGKEAFKGLPNLECVSFGWNVSSIGDSAFEGCPSLRIVNPFPKSLKSLGRRAFADCPAAGAYLFEGKPPSTSGTSSLQHVFANASTFGQYLYVNRGSWTNKVGRLSQWEGLDWVCLATNLVENKIDNLLVPVGARIDRDGLYSVACAWYNES